MVKAGFLVGSAKTQKGKQKMKIVCTHCGHTETINKRFFIKALGAAVAGLGYWAWVAYLFAGCGFAMPLCIGIRAGGVGIACFSDDIAKWVSKNFPCPDCKTKQWKVEG